MAILDNHPQPSAGPTVFGVPMKQFSLVTWTFENSILLLIMHYSRMMTPDGDHRYFTSTAILLAEVLKLGISLTFATYEVSRSLAPSTPATVLFEQIYNSVFSSDSWKLAIPATLYTLQNMLQYAGISNLDPAHYQILYQLRILTTAIFTVTMLGRSISIKRWIALVMLTIGVAIVSVPSSDSADAPFMIHDMTDHFFPRSMHELGQVGDSMGDVADHLTKRSLQGLSDVGDALMKRSATYEGIEQDQSSTPVMNYSIGLAAVLAAALVSGLTGVYLEKVLKDPATSVSIWVRNIQLSLFSLVPVLFIGVVLKDGEDIVMHGFFDGYNWVVWSLIVLQAVGGVLSSLCINYADNISKNFATSLSIIISFTCSVVFFETKITLMFLIGTILVLISIFLYSGADRKSRPPPIRIASFEGPTIDHMNTPRYTDEKTPNPMESLKAMALSTSRPASPLRHHSRVPSSQRKNRDD